MSERTIPAELKLSDSHRQAILYIELLGLIHDLGKLTDTFLRKEASNASNQDKKKYDYWLFVDPRKLYTQTETCQTVHNWRKNADNKACAFNDRPDLTDTLRSVKLTAWDGIEYCLAELPLSGQDRVLERQRQMDEGTGKKHATRYAHRLLHGIGHFEKESSGNNKTQAYINTWRSTPFGYDEEQLSTGSENNLTTTLQQLPLSQEEIQVVVQSAKEREQWLEKMEYGLSKGLADTRRPINDVTLWDWGSGSLTRQSSSSLPLSPPLA